MTPEVAAVRAAAVEAAKRLARGEISRDEAARIAEPYRQAIAEAYRRHGSRRKAPSAAALLRSLA